jgi:hypothetical protein
MNPWPRFFELQTDLKGKGKLFCQGRKREVTWAVVERWGDGGGDEDGEANDEGMSVRQCRNISVGVFQFSC